MSKLTLEKFREAMKLLELKPIDFAGINRFVESGNSMDNVHLFTSDPDFKEIKDILTTKGIVKVVYNPYTPPGQYFLFSPHKGYELMKPDFSEVIT